MKKELIQQTQMSEPGFIGLKRLLGYKFNMKFILQI